ncbi:MAG: alkaline shock response membrane anchor protein AmaP [Nocardioides sp.]
MISRTTLALDRIATLVLALVLIVGGVLGVWWWSGNSSLAAVSDTSPAQELVAKDWWPWASAVVGVVLILIALRWVAAHLSSTRVRKLNLKGSGPTGKLGVDGSKVAGAAADALAHNLGVRNAKGRVNRDRGQIVAEITATIEPEADLALIAEQADLVSAQLAQVLDRDDVRCSVRLRVARNGRSLDRVS